MGSTSITSTTAAVANPAITSAEVIEYREANLGFSGTVSTKYTDTEKVGATIRWGTITLPNSGAARSKAEGNDTSITFDVSTETAVTLTFNQWYYSAFDLEEMEENLSIVDLRAWYTKAAAYVVDLAVDDALAALPDNFTNAVGTLGVDLTDDDVRRAKQYLEDANVPGMDLFFAMAPATKNSMLGIDRYASSDFNRNGGANIITGEFGDIYGLRCWVSTNVEGANGTGHDNAIYHRDSMALGMRMTPKVHTFDDIDTLSSQVAVSVLYGVTEPRDDHGVWCKGQ